MLFSFLTGSEDGKWTLLDSPVISYKHVQTTMKPLQYIIEFPSCTQKPSYVLFNSMFDFFMRFIYSPVNGYHGGKSCSSFSSCFFHRFVTELEARSQFSHENSIEHHICGGFNFQCPQVFLMFSCKFLGFS